MADDSGAARAPVAPTTSCGPSRPGGRRLLAAFAGQVERAGYGLAHTPIFEDVRVFRRGIGEGSDVVGKEMYEFEDRGGRALALRPEGTAPIVRAFVQHRPPLPWKAWYATPAFRYERPQAGRYRQHHQLGVEALGHRGRRPGRGGGLPGRRLLPLPRAVRRSASGSTRWATRCAGPTTSTCCASYLAERRDELCPEHRDRLEANPLRVLDCKREACRRCHRRGPGPRRPSVRPVPGPLRPGGAGPRRPRRPRTGSTTDWSGGSTTTPAPPSSSRPTALESAQNGIGGGGATTAWWRCSVARRPRASGSASASSGSSWPATPRGSSPCAPVPLDAFVVDVAGGDAARDLTAELRQAGLRADRAFDGRSHEVPAEVGRPLRGPGGAHRGSRRAGSGYGVVRPLPRGRGPAHRGPSGGRWTRWPGTAGPLTDPVRAYWCRLVP